MRDGAVLGKIREIWERTISHTKNKTVGLESFSILLVLLPLLLRLGSLFGPMWSHLVYSGTTAWKETPETRTEVWEKSPFLKLQVSVQSDLGSQRSACSLWSCRHPREWSAAAADVGKVLKEFKRHLSC